MTELRVQIQEILKSKGMDFATLAAKSGVSPWTLERAAKGRRLAKDSIDKIRTVAPDVADLIPEQRFRGKAKRRRKRSPAKSMVMKERWAKAKKAEQMLNGHATYWFVDFENLKITPIYGNVASAVKTLIEETTK
jgi:transcriptional regulator with XRE-family HTH domain